MTSIRRYGPWLCVALFVGMMSPPNLAAAERPRIEIPAGQTGVVSVPDIRRVAVGDGKVLEVEVLREAGQILLIGLTAGVTDLRTWSDGGRSRHYLVRVKPKASESIEPQIAHLLEGLDGIDVRTVNGETLLTG
jgi:Flp pilus assembly secretin CpaC